MRLGDSLSGNEWRYHPTQGLPKICQTRKDLQKLKRGIVAKFEDIWQILSSQKGVVSVPNYAQKHKISS